MQATRSSDPPWATDFETAIAIPYPPAPRPSDHATMEPSPLVRKPGLGERTRRAAPRLLASPRDGITKRRPRSSEIVAPRTQSASGRRHPHDVPAGAGRRRDRQGWQIARNERRSIEILDVGEAQLADAGVQVSRIEIAPERLAACRHPLGHLLVMSARRGICDPIGRVGVVE